MREIKYKALVVKTQLDNLGSNMHLAGVSEYEEMIKVQTISFDNGKVDYVTDEDMEEYSFADNSLKAVVQYTGLKDKNGKEIYEGDIDSDDHNNLFVICYIEKYGAYCAVPLPLYLHENYEDEVVYQYGYDCYFHNCTPERYINIIGNIYQNPELLEG